jgi:hypothetical protein
MSPIDMIYLPLQHLNLTFEPLCTPTMKTLIGAFHYSFSREITLLPALTVVSGRLPLQASQASGRANCWAGGYSVVFPSKCSLSDSASALVECTTPSRWFGGE